MNHIMSIWSEFYFSMYVFFICMSFSKIKYFNENYFRLAFGKHDNEQAVKKFGLKKSSEAYFFFAKKTLTFFSAKLKMLTH